MNRKRPRLPLRAACLGPLLVPALLFACTNSPAPEQSPAENSDPAPPPAAVELPDRGEFVDQGLGLSAGTRAELRAELGEPDSVSSEVMPNRHVAGVVDTIFTLHYSDLVARIHHPGGGGDLMSMLQVSSNRHLRYPVIGLDAATVGAAFGRPDEASDSSMTYYCTSCVAGDDPVQLLLEDGTVRRVRFNYYVD